MNKKQPWTNQEEILIKAKYPSLTTKEIQQLLPHRSVGAISKHIQKIGISGTKPSYHRYNIDESYFSKISQSAKYAGFIAADGHISKKSEVIIVLSYKDKSILENFKKELKYNGPIKDRIHLCTLNNKTYNHVRISISNKKICTDLATNFNLIKGKKFDRLIPPQLTSDEDIMSFMAGFIEGDGCISISRHARSKKKYLSLEICGNTQLLKWFLFHFDRWYPYDCIYHLNRKRKQIYKTNGTKLIIIQGKRAVNILNKINQHLINTKQFRLMRKWSILEKFISDYKKK